MPRKCFLAAIACLFAFSSIALAQTTQRLNHQAPDGAELCFQLTDGTVLCQGNAESDWYKLTPDNTGSYVNGTWTKQANLPAGYVPDAFASAVLADGRLVITGGEYLNGVFTLTNLGAIYDPAANTWTNLPPPASWQYIGDSPSVVLPNGTFMVGNKLTKSMAILNPKTLTWTVLPGTGKSDFNAEEGWTLLADGSVLTEDVKNAPNSERYVPASTTRRGKSVLRFCVPTALCLPPVRTLVLEAARATPQSTIPKRKPGLRVRISRTAITRAITSPCCCPMEMFWWKVFQDRICGTG
ncbi:MAG: hypothetical protein ABSG72_07300 [Candidatus Sulfotelmatobacter sp.]